MKHLIAVLALILPASSAWSQATQPTTRPAPAALPADKILGDMMKSSGNAPKPLQPANEPLAVDKSTGPAAVAPGAPTMNVMREGTFLVDRTGRLAASADGQAMEFVFDADGRAMRDPPLIVLPNLKLMAMENLITSSTRDLRFRITGMVTEYRGRNYVLLEKVVQVPDVNQQF